MNVADGIFLLSWWCQEFLDRIKKDGYFLVVLLNLSCQLAVGRQHLTELYKGSHDGHVDLGGSVAVQDAGKHSDTLLGEDIWWCAAAAASFEVPIWNLNKYIEHFNAKLVEAGFNYSSGENTVWETVESLRKLITAHVDPTFKV